MIDFGKSLKKLRSEKGFSQEVFSSKIGIHVTNLSKYEREISIPSLEVAEKMATVLEISLDKLVYGDENEKAQKNITDTELLMIFRKAQSLKEEDKKCVKSLLNAYLFKKDIQKQLS